MRTRFVLLAVALFAVGLAVGLSAPTTQAQAAADPCAAPWDVVTGQENPDGGHKGGFYVVKFNRCTGDTLIFAADDMEVSGDTWYKPGVK